MNKSKIWLAVLSISVLLASCASAPSAMESFSKSESGVAMDRAEMPAEAPIMEEEMYFDEGAADSSFSSSNVTDNERIVIKNADLSIVVEDPSDAMGMIGDMAKEMGGFVVYSNLYKTTTSQGVEVPNANITIRVPAEKLEAAMNEIKSLVEDKDIDILSENVSGEDVTSQVTDLESRLRNLEAAEEQLLDIMDQVMDTESVIEVFRELTSVREEIEVIQGQIKYYRESAQLSALSVYLQAKAAVAPITIGGWQPGVVAQRALQALVNGAQKIVDALIWLALFVLPILAVIFLPVFFIARYFIRRKAKKAQKDKPETKKVA